MNELKANCGELTRVLRLWTANDTYETIGFRADESNSVVADYVGGERSCALHSTFRVTSATPGSEFATNDSRRLLDYIEGGLFDASEELDLTEHDGKLVVRGKGATVTLHAVNYNEVPRITAANAFGSAPGSHVVVSNPSLRSAGTLWADWTERGYGVAIVPITELRRVASASNLVYRRFKQALVQLSFDANGSTARIAPAMDDTGDAVLLGELDGVKMEMPVRQTNAYPMQFAVLHSVLVPVLASLDLSTATTVIVVKHPEEYKVNFLLGEDTAGTTPEPSLRLTHVVATWQETA